jgi:hypothetical protein
MIRSSQEKRDLSVSAPELAPAEGPLSRRPLWARPTLVVHGDLRELTMGPTPGQGESGAPLVLLAPG